MAQKSPELYRLFVLTPVLTWITTGSASSPAGQPPNYQRFDFCPGCGAQTERFLSIPLYWSEISF
jgi:hypothetical protein